MEMVILHAVVSSQLLVFPMPEHDKGEVREELSEGRAWRGVARVRKGCIDYSGGERDGGARNLEQGSRRKAEGKDVTRK